MFSRIAAILLSLAALSCSSSDPGSGGGIGGTGIQPIAATGATQGSISSFGSIVVNGVRFNTDNASFFVNDKPISQGDLRVGMNVLASVDFDNSVASQVSYVPSLIGPVESIDFTNKSIRSMGQTIRMGASTAFENTSLADIAPGMVVEVSGVRNAAGVIYASFIRTALDTTQFQLVGAILSDLGDSQEFSLNGLQVNISNTDLSLISINDLEFGDKVYVTAPASSYDPAQPLMTANIVRIALQPMLVTGERVEYEGIVSKFVSSFEFDVYWQPVTATALTKVEFQDGTLADLSMITLNTRVEIEAVVQQNGAYQASKIILIATENSKISGIVEGISTDTSSFTILGMNIQVGDDTQFEGSSDNNETQEISSFDELRVGDYVEVESAFLGNRLAANAVEVDDPRDRATIEGPVTNLDVAAGTFTVMNRVITFGEQTSYEKQNDEVISRQEFFELIQNGVVVKATWDDFESVDVPLDSIEIE